MDYSIVIPLKDEVESLPLLVEEILTAMAALDGRWELICVDDGSTDGTRELLTGYSQRYSFFRPLFFDKNYGQSSAFMAGFRAASGEWVITLDGDGQNDPADISLLVERAQRGDVDLVCGRRIVRRDSPFKRLCSRMANLVRGCVCQDGVRDTGCSLKIYRRRCLQLLPPFRGMHRFFPALFVQKGFRLAEVDVHHRPRCKGATKYSLRNRHFNTIVDMFAVRWLGSRQLHYQLTEPSSGQKADG